MPGFHHHLIDFIEDLGRKQLHIVLEGLQMIAQIVIREAMAQHLANGPVVIHQLLQPVKIAIQAQPQCAHDKYLPQGHARTAHFRIDRRRRELRQHCKYRRSERLVGIQILQAAKQLGNIIAGTVIKTNVGNINLA